MRCRGYAGIAVFARRDERLQRERRDVGVGCLRSTGICGLGPDGIWFVSDNRLAADEAVWCVPSVLISVILFTVIGSLADVIYALIGAGIAEIVRVNF